jgi:hypothetical protein
MYEQKCDGQRPACSRCIQASSSCVYEITSDNSTRYQSLRTEHSNLTLESRKLHDLIDALTDVPTRERSVILDHFRASKDSASALTLARQVLARAALIPVESHETITADDSCPRHRSACLCGDVEHLSMNTWERLLDEYWKHYSADLPFLHASSFLHICYTYGRNRGPHDNKFGRCACCDSSLHEYTPVLLAFLALTSRHRPDLILWTHRYGENASSGITKSSETYASSAERHLQDSITSHKPGEYGSLHARLMLTLYNCSMARCSKALLLLGGAVVVARSMNLDRGADDVSGGSPVLSTALAHESTMMRSAATKKREDDVLDAQNMLLNTEIRTRTFWSCYILDSQLHLGKGRRRLLQDQTLSVQQHATHDEYWFDIRENSDRSHMAPSGHTGSSMNTFRGLQHADPEEPGFAKTPLAPSVTSSGLPWPCLRTNMIAGEGDGRGKGVCHESPLSQYIKAMNLLAQISSWALCGGRRYVFVSIGATSKVYSRIAESSLESLGMSRLAGTSSFDAF